MIPIAQKGDDHLQEDDRIQVIKGKNEQVLQFIEEGMTAGGTVWLWADPSMWQQLTTLIIDEATRFPWPDVLRRLSECEKLNLVSWATRSNWNNRSRHPILKARTFRPSGIPLNGHATILADRGIFLIPRGGCIRICVHSVRSSFTRAGCMPCRAWKISALMEIA
ncbi:MAG: hypothetical protein R2806_20440 [Saprospiraceae bacterium]